MLQLPATTPQDWILLGLTLIALDILLPPWPTLELIFIIPFKLFKITRKPVVYGEVVAQSFAATILFAAFLRWGPILVAEINANLQTLLKPETTILTLALAGILGYFIYKEVFTGEEP